MQEKARRIVIVCGYGCSLDSLLMPYLNRVADFCRGFMPNDIILLGGATQRKLFPGKTEADVAYSYLSSILPSWSYFGPANPIWHRAYDVYTAFDAIKEAAVIVNDLHLADEASSFHGRGEKITVFCEATRALKVDMLIRHFLSRKANEPRVHLETVSWELGSPSRELVGTIQTWLSIRVPFLNTLLRWQRIRKSKTR